MSVRTLADVATYIDKYSIARTSQLPQEQYEHFEMACITVLDSEFDNYPDGVLESFLMDYLATKRKQLGL